MTVAGQIGVLAVLGGQGGLLAVSTLAVLVFVCVAFVLTRGDGSSVYDQIGAGGLSRDGEHAGAAPAPAPGSAAALLEREQEIRQMLHARSERLVRAGEPALDVDAELARLLTDEHDARGGRAGDRHDAELLAEVRQLVQARNERRARQGLEPLDVEAEVARTLAELGS